MSERSGPVASRSGQAKPETKECAFCGQTAGFSDHTIGLTAPMTAFARGASIVEKHFTLDKDMYGPDHAGSMTPEELRQLHAFRTELTVCL